MVRYRKWLDIETSLPLNLHNGVRLCTGVKLHLMPISNCNDGSAEQKEKKCWICIMGQSSQDEWQHSSQVCIM